MPDNRSIFEPNQGAKDPRWKTSHTMVVAALLFSVYTFSFVGSKTMIPFWITLSVVILFMVLSFIVAGARLGKEKGFLWGTGVAPSFLSLLLWLNFAVRSETRFETYDVVQYHIDYKEYPSIAEIIYQYEGRALHEFEETRRFAFVNENMINAPRVEYQFERGLLGVDVLINKEPVY